MKYQDMIKSVLISDFAIVPIEPDALVVLDVHLNEATCYSFNPEGANCKSPLSHLRDDDIEYCAISAFSLSHDAEERRSK